MLAKLTGYLEIYFFKRACHIAQNDQYELNNAARIAIALLHENGLETKKNCTWLEQYSYNQFIVEEKNNVNYVKEQP